MRYHCRFFNTSFGTQTRPAKLLDSANHPLMPTTSQKLSCVVPPSKTRCIYVRTHTRRPSPKTPDRRP